VEGEAVAEEVVAGKLMCLNVLISCVLNGHDFIPGIAHHNMWYLIFYQQRRRGVTSSFDEVANAIPSVYLYIMLFLQYLQ
jgi:hypothetical protein